MTRPLVVRPEAERDMAEAADWYDGREVGVGRTFLLAARALLDAIRDNPESYAAEREGVRRALVDRFPYIVVYRLTDDAIEVFAVMHTSRHPRAWRSRL